VVVFWAGATLVDSVTRERGLVTAAFHAEVNVNNEPFETRGKRLRLSIYEYVHQQTTFLPHL
jgi:hypothetical protein